MDVTLLVGLLQNPEVQKKIGGLLGGGSNGQANGSSLLSNLGIGNNSQNNNYSNIGGQIPNSSQELNSVIAPTKTDILSKLKPSISNSNVSLSNQGSTPPDYTGVVGDFTNKTDKMFEDYKKFLQSQQEQQVLGVANPNTRVHKGFEESAFMLGKEMNYDAETDGYMSDSAIEQAEQEKYGLSAMYATEAVQDFIENSMNKNAFGIIANGFGAVRNFLSGTAYANRSANVAKHYAEKRRDGIIGNYTRMEDGGNISSEEYALQQLLTQGVEIPNAEVEGNEYIQSADGSVNKVEGKSHEQGGELVHLEPTDNVISDNLKIGSAKANEFKKMGLNVSAKDTFAKVIDKYTKHIGLEKKQKELQELLGKLEEQDKNTDAKTAEFNKQFLQDKIVALQEETQRLEKQKELFVRNVFNKQEQSKGNTQGHLSQEGLPKFDDGGNLIKRLSKQYGVSEEVIEKLVEEYQNGGGKGKRANISLNQETFNQLGLTEDELVKMNEIVLLNKFALEDYVHQKLDKNRKTYGGIGGEVERIEELSRVIPFINKYFSVKDGEIEFLKGKEGVKEFQEEYQKFIYDTKNYYKDVLGYDEKLLDLYIDRIKFLDGDNVDTARLFDSLFGQFTSSRSGFRRRVVTPEQLKKLNEKGIYFASQVRDNEEAKTLLGEDTFNKVTDRLGDYGSADYRLDSIDEAPAEETPNEENTENNGQTPYNSFQANGKVNPIYKNILLPDQTMPPPRGVTPHLKITRRYDRLDPIKLSDEEQRKEIARSQDVALSLLNNMPDSQRASVLASLTANAQNTLSKTISDIEHKNAVNSQTTETFNIGQSDKEEEARAMDLSNFEKLQYIANSKTEKEFHDWLQHNIKVRVNEYNTLQRFNLLDRASQFYTFDEYGNIIADPTVDVKLARNKNAGNKVVAEKDKKKSESNKALQDAQLKSLIGFMMNNKKG